MTAPRLFGPLPLAADRVEKHLQANSPGVYALGEIVNGTFVIRVIGRADEDLRIALKAFVSGSYKHFKFSYALSPRDAFAKECQLFHSLEVLHARQPHPTPPKGMDLRCWTCAYTERAGSD